MKLSGEIVCFLISDIEGSTPLLDRAPEAYARVLQKHHQIFREESGRRGGMEFHEAGDSLFFAFPESAAAVEAALAIQERMSETADAKLGGALRVRMGLHAGPAVFREGQYRGVSLNIAVRLCDAGHGGAVLGTGRVASQVAAQDVCAERLGTYRLRGIQEAQEIWVLSPAAAPASEAKPLRAAHARAHNLPPAADRLFGRDAELARCREALLGGNETLVTITGAGGIGKTSLALAAARSLLEEYDHAVYFLSLAGESHAGAIPHLLLAPLGVAHDEQRDVWEEIAEALKGSRALVLLDNLEQFGAEAAGAIESLRNRVKNLTLLATSRTRLLIPGEREVVVPPFPLPGDETDVALKNNPAVALFLERMQRARAATAGAEIEVKKVAKVCRELGGLPLAIEIAAARMQVMTLDELEQALRSEQGLGHAGAGAEQEAVERLEKIIDWSLEMLPDAVAKFLAGLAAFRGSFAAPASAVVAGEGKETRARGTLQYLMNCSLVQTSGAGVGALRFQLLEPIRQLLEKRNPEAVATAQERHRAHYAGLAGNHLRTSDTPEEAHWTRVLEEDWRNFSAALKRCTSAADRYRMACDLQVFAMRTARCREVRESLPTPDEGERLEDAEAMGKAWQAAGVLDSVVGETECAIRSLELARDCFLKAGRIDASAIATMNLACMATELGHLEKAKRLYGECLPCFEAQEEKLHAGVALTNLSILHDEAGDWEEARQCARHAVEILSQEEAPIPLADAWLNYSHMLGKSGDHSAAKEAAVACMRLLLRHGHASEFANPLCELGDRWGQTGNWAFAARCAGLAQALHNGHRTLTPSQAVGLEEFIATCRRHLPSAEFDMEFSTGSRLTPAALLEQALASDSFTSEKKQQPELVTV